jgi:hypothetical protein
VHNNGRLLWACMNEWVCACVNGRASCVCTPPFLAATAGEGLGLILTCARVGRPGPARPVLLGAARTEWARRTGARRRRSTPRPARPGPPPPHWRRDRLSRCRRCSVRLSTPPFPLCPALSLCLYVSLSLCLSVSLSPSLPPSFYLSVGPWGSIETAQPLHAGGAAAVGGWPVRYIDPSHPSLQ